MSIPWTKAARTDSSNDAEPSLMGHCYPAEDALLDQLRRRMRKPRKMQLAW